MITLRPFICPALSACLMVIPFTIAAQPNTDGSTKAGELPGVSDRIVFLGDSITQKGDYIVDVQCWLLARGITAECINLGLGSETATDLTPQENAGHLQAHQFVRPPISERLGRALKMTSPDLLFVCYGMNDGGSLPADDNGLKRFADSITWLREAALKSGVRRVILCTPPVHDAKGDVSKLAHDANLTRYTSWLLSKRKDGWEVVDFHTPMRKVLDQGRAANPAFALAADGTHPGREGHWIMAKELLQGSFGEDVITVACAEDFFLSNGKEIRFLICELTHLRFDHWMSRIGHERPGVPGGPVQSRSSDVETFALRETACQRAIKSKVETVMVPPTP